MLFESHPQHYLHPVTEGWSGTRAGCGFASKYGDSVLLWCSWPIITSINILALPQGGVNSQPYGDHQQQQTSNDDVRVKMDTVYRITEGVILTLEVLWDLLRSYQPFSMISSNQQKCIWDIINVHRIWRKHDPFQVSTVPADEYG